MMPQGPEGEIMAEESMLLCEIDRQNKEQRVQRPTTKKNQQGQSRPPDAECNHVNRNHLFIKHPFFFTICASYLMGERLGVGKAEGKPWFTV